MLVIFGAMREQVKYLVTNISKIKFFLFPFIVFLRSLIGICLIFFCSAFLIQAFGRHVKNTRKN